MVLRDRPLGPQGRAAIAAIEDTAWTAIHYPHAVRDADTGELISDAQVAEVAETPFVAFTGRRKADHVPCRLVVRRVTRLGAADGDQGELFTPWWYHAFITNSTLTCVDADTTHRQHAIVEQVIAELYDGLLAHLPSGRYPANAA